MTNIKRMTVIFISLTVSLCTLLTTSDGLAQSVKMVFQNFDGSVPPTNKEGDGYPAYYSSDTEGGPFTTSLSTTQKIGGSSSLQMHMTSGINFYAQWNSYDGVGRDFARSYSADPAHWQFNTYNRFRYWLWIPTENLPEYLNSGQTNLQMGTYVKYVTNADPTSDEAGGGHFYHGFNILRNQWSLCVFNSHPGHRRGVSGSEDSGNLPYPTTPAYGGSGDPDNTYNYFDTLTRFYIEDSAGATTNPFPRDYFIDEMEFYQEPYPENDDQVYSLCVSYNPGNNRIFLTWNRPKDENSVKHEVRYAFSNIHVLGWSNATAAPNGIITPQGFQGYNGMVYDTTAINVSGQSMLYLAVKPENSSVFSQIALPLTSLQPTAQLAAPTNLRVVTP